VGGLDRTDLARVDLGTGECVVVGTHVDGVRCQLYLDLKERSTSRCSRGAGKPAMRCAGWSSLGTIILADLLHMPRSLLRWPKYKTSGRPPNLLALHATVSSPHHPLLLGFLDMTNTDDASSYFIESFL
jgi:hypothetical protein